MAAMREILGEGRYLRLVRQDQWEFCERRNISGIVVLIAVTDARELVLVEQERPAVGARVLELPAGLAGDQGAETLEGAARRELLEETGYEAARLVRIGDATPSAGLCSEIVTFFGATGLRKTGPGGGDETEKIVVHRMPLSAPEPWLAARRAQGALLDEKIYAGLFFVRRLAPFHEA
jgi:ADP-ribose pyrophosphatase